MKSLFLKMGHFLKLLWNSRKYLFFRKINKKLYKTIEDREVDRIILKGKIVEMVRQYVTINRSSEFVPPWYKSNMEIKQEVLNKFGDDMQRLGIKIYNNLKLSA